jgi:hypothetical protein
MERSKRTPREKASKDALAQIKQARNEKAKRTDQYKVQLFFQKFILYNYSCFSNNEIYKRNKQKSFHGRWRFI